MLRYHFLDIPVLAFFLSSVFFETLRTAAVGQHHPPMTRFDAATQPSEPKSYRADPWKNALDYLRVTMILIPQRTLGMTQIYLGEAFSNIASELPAATCIGSSPCMDSP